MKTVRSKFFFFLFLFLSVAVEKKKAVVGFHEFSGSGTHPSFDHCNSFP